MLGISSRMKKQRKNKNKNKGAAIVMVIVAIAFVGMLVSMILYMSYANYLMKSNDKIAKNNFYTAESALALVNAGLQKEITTSMAEAYVMSTQLSSGKTDAEISILFRRFFRADMLQKLCLSSELTSTTQHWDPDPLRSMITAENTMTLAATAGERGVRLESVAADPYLLDVQDNAMTLRDVSITFMDDNGYISKIVTDIEIVYPLYQPTTANVGLNLQNYSLIANNCLVNDHTYIPPTADNVPSYVSSGSSTTVKGNVFGGNDGIYVKDNASLNFVDDTTDSTDSYDLIANSMNIENTTSGTVKGIAVDSKFKNYLGEITLRKNAVLNLDGITKVKNDLDIVGNNANVKLSGVYYGFGSSTTDANESSSIMVNGADASIDFSDLKELKLCGNAFVGATHYDADELRRKAVFDITDFTKSIYHSKYAVKDAQSDYIEDIKVYDEMVGDPLVGFTPDDSTVSRNSADVLTGQSIAVKADQMMYMVPADCIGFLHNTTTQVIAKNPLSIEEYEKLTTTFKTEGGVVTTEPYYDLYNLSPLMEKLDSNYHVDVKEVFRRVNGTVLVYLYLDFGSNQFEANRFFYDYSQVFYDSFNTYVNSYVKSYKWNSDLDSQLTIAGNAFALDSDDKVVIKKENISTDDDKMIDLYNNIPIYEQAYNGMLHMLTTNTMDLSEAQLGYDVYTNLVSADVADTSKLGNCEFGLNADASSFDAFGKLTDDAMLKAKTVVGDYYYRKADKDRNIKLIVTTGDLYITCDYDGLAIAGGNIYVCGDTAVGTNCANINYNSADVYSILTGAKNKDGAFAYAIFGTLGAANYATGEKKHNATSEMNTSEYVRYHNWKKE